MSQVEGFDMEKFQQDLRHYEGVHYTIYPDPLHTSHATVGVGHLLIPGDKHYGIDQSQASIQVT